jgi:hypothetical protein
LPYSRRQTETAGVLVESSGSGKVVVLVLAPTVTLALTLTPVAPKAMEVAKES